MAKNPEQITLPSEEAAVQERQVTVRVLTVGTKQITQTLYRQLVEEDVIDDATGCLLGPVWGWVNLHVSCDVKGRHLHVIWEDHGQLKRTCTRPFNSSQKYGVSDAYYDMQEELKDLATIYVCLVALANKSFNHWNSDRKTYGSVELPLTIKGILVSVPVPDRVRDIFDAPTKIEKWSGFVESKNDKEYYQKQVDYLTQDVTDFLSGELKDCFNDREWGHLKHCNPEQYTSYDDVHKAMEEIASKMTALEQNWQRSYKAIEDAGQLFIAVSGVWK